MVPDVLEAAPVEYSELQVACLAWVPFERLDSVAGEVEK
jgi:hypothetical protein